MKKMTRFLMPLSLLAGLFLFSCGDDNVEVIDSSEPVGMFSVESSGTFVEQNDTGTAGMAQLGTDGEDSEFLRFSDNFTTNLGTGTVTVYLSTSATFTTDPGNGNPDLRLVGFVQSNGEQFFKIEPAAASQFTHVILWCASAGIPFGYAALQ